MSNQNIERKISELKDLEALAKELQDEIETIKDELKAVMIERNTSELCVGTHTMRYTEVLSNRFDTTAFKKVMPGVYKEYTKQVTSRRFTIA